jgi:mannose-6-phosphate isomerase-like protein (cupin superfamily)
MRTALIGLAFVLGSIPVSAQQPSTQASTPPAQIVTFASAADVAALMAKAAATRKPDQANLVQPLLRLPPYTANLEHRGGVGPAAVHEKEAELFYVIDGAGTIVTGGKLTAESRTNAENLTGSGIEGGQARKVGKGDFVLVPENTPHWFSVIDGTLTLMSIHVPR